MKLYEIMPEIEKLIDEAVDTETGEIIDGQAKQALDELMLERENAISNLALYYKNQNSDAEALANEERAFRTRRQRAERKAEWAKKMVEMLADGEKISTDKFALSYRRSEKVVLNDGCSEADVDNRFIKAELTLMKADAKKAIKNGEDIKGVHLEESISMSIR